MVEAAIYISFGFLWACLLFLWQAGALRQYFYRRISGSISANGPLSRPLTLARIDSLKAHHAVESQQLQIRIESLNEAIGKTKLALRQAEDAAEAAQRDLRIGEQNISILEEKLSQAQGDIRFRDETIAHLRSSSGFTSAVGLTNQTETHGQSQPAIEGNVAAIHHHASASASDEWAENLEDADIPADEREALIKFAELQTQIASFGNMIENSELIHRQEFGVQTVRKLQKKIIDLEGLYVAAQAEVARLATRLDSLGSARTRLPADTYRAEDGADAVLYEEKNEISDRNLQILADENKFLRTRIADLGRIGSLRAEIGDIAALFAADHLSSPVETNRISSIETGRKMRQLAEKIGQFQKSSGLPNGVDAADKVRLPKGDTAQPAASQHPPGSIEEDVSRKDAAEPKKKAASKGKKIRGPANLSDAETPPPSRQMTSS